MRGLDTKVIDISNEMQLVYNREGCSEKWELLFSDLQNEIEKSRPSGESFNLEDVRKMAKEIAEKK